MTPASKLLLWDGKQYALEKLHSYPELISYCSEHPILREDVPFRAQRIDEGKSLFLGLLLAFPFAIFLIFEQAINRGFASALLMGLICAVVPFLILFSRRTGTYLWNDRIEMRNGIVYLHYGNSMFPIKAPLSQCQWYLGPASDGDRTRYDLQDLCVIIVLPPRGIFRKQIRAACGWTDELRTVLKEFLTVAQVPTNK